MKDYQGNCIAVQGMGTVKVKFRDFSGPLSARASAGWTDFQHWALGSQERITLRSRPRHLTSCLKSSLFSLTGPGVMQGTTGEVGASPPKGKQGALCSSPLRRWARVPQPTEVRTRQIPGRMGWREKDCAAVCRGFADRSEREPAVAGRVVEARSPVRRAAVGASATMVVIPGQPKIPPPRRSRKCAVEVHPNCATDQRCPTTLRSTA